jgi:hypothetical protein
MDDALSYLLKGHDDPDSIESATKLWKNLDKLANKEDKTEYYNFIEEAKNGVNLHYYYSL